MVSLTSCKPTPPQDQLIVAHDISQIITLDPGRNNNALANEMIQQLYESLYRLDPAAPMGVAPGLASDYSVSDDLRVYEFKIDRDAFFSTGNPVTAFDAEASLRRVIDLNGGGASSFLAIGLNRDNVEQRIKALDDYRLMIKLPKPVLPHILLGMLALPASSVLDMKAFSEASKASTSLAGSSPLNHMSLGSGPFRLTTWRPNDIIIMSRSENYWRGRPRMKRVIFRHIAEPSVRALLLKLKDVDMAFTLTPHDRTDLEKQKSINIRERKMPNFTYIGMNQKVPELANPRVRLALKHLVDYQRLADTLMQDRGIIHETFVPSGALGEVKSLPFKRDPEKARQLLEQSGVNLPISLKLYTLSTSPMIDIAQSIQNSAREVGINIEIIQMIGAQLWPLYRARQHELVLAAWSNGYPDPHSMAESFIINPDNSDQANLSGRPAWRNSWRDVELVNQALAAAALVNPDERAESYRKIQEDFFERSPFVFLFQGTAPIAMQDTVNGLFTSAYRISYADVTKK